MATSAVPMTPPTGAPNTTSPVQTFREVVCFNGSTNETDWLDALTDGFDFPGNDDASMWAVEDDGSVSDQECTDGMEMFFLEWNAEADAYVRACLQIGAACTITGWDPLVIMAAVPITPSPPGDDDFPVWAIILIVVGGIGFLGLVAFVIVQQTKKPTFGMSFGDQCCALDEMEHENEMNYTGYSQNNKPGMAM
ncbi:hypothetical protein DIPPA_34585 [Diplonema papillatum]|nr:hypothetical protein DIPPA_34585 [Diplonema papillatum]